MEKGATGAGLQQQRIGREKTLTRSVASWMEGGGPLSFLAPKIFFIAGSPLPLRLVAAALPCRRRRRRGRVQGSGARAGRGGIRNRDVDRGLPVKTISCVFVGMPSVELPVGSGRWARHSVQHFNLGQTGTERAHPNAFNKPTRQHPLLQNIFGVLEILCFI